MEALMKLLDTNVSAQTFTTTCFVLICYVLFFVFLFIIVEQKKAKKKRHKKTANGREEIFLDSLDDFIVQTDSLCCGRIFARLVKDGKFFCGIFSSGVMGRIDIFCQEVMPPFINSEEGAKTYLRIRAKIIKTKLPDVEMILCIK